MELVYLWIEDYKNIKKQGFNFSPKYECTYENKKLNIVDKEKTKAPYLKNFFGNNINVTAIVGENGSGKSSIFKSLIYLIYSLHLESKKDKNNSIKTNEFPLKAFITFKISGKYKYISYNIDDKNIQLEKLTDVMFYSIYCNYLLDSFNTKEPYDNFINDLYHKSDIYTTPILLEPSKANDTMNLSEYNYKNNNMLFKQFTDDIRNKFIKTFFNPTKFEMKIDKRKINNKFEDFINPTFGSPILFNKTYNDLKNKTFDQFTMKSKEEVRKDVERLFEEGNYRKINNIYFATKILMQKVDSGFRDKLFHIIYYENDIIDSLNKKIASINKREVLAELFTIDIYDFEKEKLEKSIIFEEELLNDKKRLELFNSLFSGKHGYKFNDIDTIRPIKSFIPPWINVKFYEEDKCFDWLSSGEKQYITLMINLVYQINNLVEVKEYNTINLMLDEVELSLHPNWQKRFIFDLVKLLKEYNKTINIILSSHSPFILSDLPKENVIFLDKYKKDDIEVQNGIQKLGNCKNVTKETEINPFGANIHTLLSHGFFMEDGLMGEFAKDKINEIIDFLNDKKKIEDISTPFNQIKIVIENIGEAFLQAKLKQMYNEKFALDDELDELKKQQIKINKKIENLKKQKSEDAKS